MHSLMIFFLTFAALAAAIPHAIHDHAHGHRALVARSESYDGACGNWGGATCRAGFCCGPNGWCGNAEEHCGTGCQPGFGECGDRSSPEYGAPPQSSVNDPQSSVGGPESSESGPRSYGAPPSTTDVTVHPGPPSSYPTSTPSSEQPTTETPPTTDASPTLAPPTSEPPQPTSSSESASSSPESSAESTTYVPSSSSSASSAAPTDTSPTTTSYGSATPTPTSGGGGQSQGGPYLTTFKGDGSEGNGWPSQDQWLPFETLWQINQDIMNTSCSKSWDLGSGTDNTEEELAELKSAIADISSETKIDKSFIYVVMQQESLGCVRVRTTSNAHANPGLFQSNQGTGSCNDGGNLQIPCPQSEIRQMVEDGVTGTSSGDGLEQLLGQATGEAAQKYYRAARMYNSGSMDPSGNLARGGATACYCSDLANRLLGWSQGTSKCTAADASA